MSSLEELGWRPYFATQLQAGDTGLAPARVVAVHRDRLGLDGAGVPATGSLPPRLHDAGVAVGDWVLVDTGTSRVARLLQRFGAFRRRAAGQAAEIQWLAANVDTVFVVTSANRDFNVARLERYLALARDAGAWPVIVITKADGVPSPVPFVEQAQDLLPGLVVEALDARDAEAVGCLACWCGSGQTVALLGSSGVGKSTLINSLAGSHQETRAARADDQRGRHTTTARSMHRLPAGGWLIDTPGMRELQLAGMAEALDDVFSEITQLAAECRFGDCRHGSEPGCRVQAAITDGSLDPERLQRYRKLLAEDAHNSASIAERRERDRTFGKLIKSVMTERERKRHGEH